MRAKWTPHENQPNSVIDHDYNTGCDTSVRDFLKPSRDDTSLKFYGYLPCFRPGSIDPGRLFPYGGLAKKNQFTVPIVAC